MPTEVSYLRINLYEEFPWGLPYQKDAGARQKISKRILNWFQDPVLWTCLEPFSPVRGNNPNTTPDLLL